MLSKFALSNSALPAFDHAALLPGVRELGFTGLEVVPGRVWADVGRDATPAAVAAYRRAVESAGLQVVGLHGLLDGHPELGLFGAGERVRRTAERVLHLSAICRDLGGYTLILDRGRLLDGGDPKQAWHSALALLESLVPQLEEHGTLLCFAPQEPAPQVFCASARECRIMTVAVDHPAFGLQLNSAALVAHGEANHATFSAIYGYLDHFALNEPGGVPLGCSGCIDHAALRPHLSSGGFHGWVSIQQEATPVPFDGIAVSARLIDEIYRRPDNLSLELRRQARAENRVS